MNQFLAELYGTGENIGVGDDAEKLAQAEVVNQLLESEGLSVDDVDAHTILKVAHELFGPDNELQKVAEEEYDDEDDEDDDDETEKESADKLAEADFIGRMMAHAYVNELSNMEKEAGPRLDRVGAALKGAWGKAKSAPGRAGEWAKEPAATFKKRKTPWGLGRGSRRVEGIPGDTTSRALWETIKAHKGQTGAAAGLLAAAGTGAGLGIKKLRGKKKESSAIDALAEARAYEILEQYQGGNTKLASAVEDRAWQMLVEAGYVE